MLCWSVWRFCFFAEHVRVLVKNFQDYYSLLYLLETIKSVGMQRQSWSSVTFRRLQCLSTKTITVFFSFQRQSSPLTCGDNHGHPLSLFSRLLQSSLSSRDNQVRWHAETIMVIRFRCFQDYSSLLCLPETIKSVGMRRQSWSSVFVVFKTIPVFFAFQRQSSLLACGDYQCLPLFIFSKTIRVFCFKDNVSFSLQDLEVFYWYTWCLLCSFFW